MVVDLKKLDDAEQPVYSALMDARIGERVIFHSVCDMLGAGLDGRLERFMDDGAWPEGNEAVLAVAGDPVEVSPDDLAHRGFYHNDAVLGDSSFAEPDVTAADTAMRLGLEYFARHPGNVAAEDWREGDTTKTKPQEAMPKDLEPMTTKAGQHIFGITFAAPAEAPSAEGSSTRAPAPSKVELHARYPMQLLIRVDTARQRLVYDAFDACFESPVNVSRSLPSEKMFNYGARRLGIPTVGHRVSTYSSSDSSDTGEPVRLPYGYHLDGRRATWAVYLGGEFFTGRLLRLAMPLEDLSGIRLHCPDPNHRGCLILEWSVTPGMHIAENERSGHTSKVTPVVSCDLGKIETVQPGAFTPFAVRQVSSRYEPHNAFTACGDWTRDATASKATRHYIYGSVAELRELAAMLATISPAVAGMLSKEGAKEKDRNTLFAGADLKPSAARPPQKEVNKKAIESMPSDEQSKSSKKRKRASTRTVDNVNNALRESGVEEKLIGYETAGQCVRRGWLTGKYPLPTSAADLDKPVWSGKCPFCEERLSMTFRQAMEQVDYGGDSYEEGGEEAEIFCKECCVGVFVTNLCTGHPTADSGKFHNHCVMCPDFGVCLGDYRESHCLSCGAHSFGERCGKCGRSGESPDWRFFSIPTKAWNVWDRSQLAAAADSPSGSSEQHEVLRDLLVQTVLRGGSENPAFLEMLDIPAGTSFSEEDVRQKVMQRFNPEMISFLLGSAGNDEYDDDDDDEYDDDEEEDDEDDIRQRFNPEMVSFLMGSAGNDDEYDDDEDEFEDEAEADWRSYQAYLRKHGL